MTLAFDSEEQSDALREVVNIAMGQAADSLARLFNVFVRLPVPRVRLVESANVLEAIGEVVGSQGPISAVRQGFYSHVRGEAIVIFGPAGCSELADLMGYQTALDADMNQELTLDLSNLLVGACLRGIAQQLAYDLSFSAPSMIIKDGQLSDMIDPKRLPWSHALLVEVNFRIEKMDFVCHVLVFWPEEAIKSLLAAVDRILEALG